MTAKMEQAPAVGLLSGRWRQDLGRLVSGACRSVLVATPYIKHDEAAWLCAQLRPGIEVVTLANVDARAVGASVLDIAALGHLAAYSPSARLFALPYLHAKVFIADERAAIVTSGNLTRSALDRNIEYGVLLEQGALVNRVRHDMRSFARLGTEVDVETISRLAPLEAELRSAHTELMRGAGRSARNRFDEAMSRARPAFAAAQVGDRSAHAVFGEAIQLILKSGPKKTETMQQEVRALLPALCDDSECFFIKGVRYGKTWKRRFRHAQQHLKRKGVIAYNASEKTWKLTNVVPKSDPARHDEVADACDRTSSDPQAFSRVS